MKVLDELTLEQKDALKFVLEEVSPNDKNVRITVKEIRQIDKLCALLEADGQKVEIEDADFQFLKSKFSNYTGWNPTKENRALIMSCQDKLDWADA